MTKIKKHWPEGPRIKLKREALGISAEKLAAILGVSKENIYKWERGSKPSDPEQHTLILQWLNEMENVPRGNGIHSNENASSHSSDRDILVNLMETMTQLMKTQNKLLEEQKENVVSKISTIETNLGSVEAGVQNIGLRYRVDREVMMKSLARIEKAPDPALLIKEADNMLLSLTQDSVTRDKKK